ncbi:hypothetical protein [Carboxylicivirga caseinilyticus]|uniref:hypothetical protein n=1 Tax=Carboxylicivirga caseinilyticus TaxID=3417572 RepID=UPI003D34F097|nr:hypothetical protein [Marinilabiliaceae bacterium A049]
MKILSDIIDNLDNISEDDNEKFIEEIEKDYDFIIGYQTNEIEELENISNTLAEYYHSLGLCNQWSKIIDRRNEVQTIISKLKGKSEEYLECYTDVEFVYACTLLESGKKINDSISVFKELTDLLPNDEAIQLKLKIAKYNRRMKVYTILWITSLGFSFVFMIFRYFKGPTPYRFYSDIGWGMYILFFLLGFIDRYFTFKNAQ